MTDEERQFAESATEVVVNQGDRWSFMAVLPDSGFVHTLHHGERNLDEATVFVGQIKEKSDGEPPFFHSDDWFYEGALLEHYHVMEEPAYKGLGRRPHKRRKFVVGLKYVQIKKKRDRKGRLLSVKRYIFNGSAKEVMEVFKK